MNDAAIITAVVIAIVAIFFTASSRVYVKRLKSLASRRVSPNLSEFIGLLRSDCEPDVALWLWDELAAYWKPIAPHPDDDFIFDLPIDHDEPNDWLAHFCTINKLRIGDFPEWPSDESTTVRNLARWFSDGRKQLRSAALD